MKKNRYLNQLLDVIRVLRGGEATVVKKHLKAYEVSQKNEPGKMLQLYNEIKGNRIHDYKKLKQIISPDSTDDSFNKLIRRTIDRVEESLIVDVNIHRKGAYSDLFRLKYHITKKIIQSQILIGRGLIDRSLHILDYCIRDSKKYEFYTELLEALRYKQMILTNSIGYQEYKNQSEIIAKFEECRYSLVRSRNIFEEINLKGFTKSQNNKISEEDKVKADLILNYYNRTKSVNILSFYYLLTIDFYKNDDKSLNVILTTQKLINLIRNSPALFSKRRLAYLLNEVSQYHLFRLDFNQALKSIEEGALYTGNRSILYYNNKTTRNNILILSIDGSRVIGEMTKYINDVFLAKNQYFLSRINYQLAIAHFIIGEFRKSLSKFSEKNEIEKDKEGWNVWIRIMRILCSIEMKRLDLIDYEIESFRKYLQRVGKQYEVRERDRLILKILIELEKQDFNFKETALQREKEIGLLQATDKKTGWNPDSPEMILFHDWFQAKRLKKAYEPNYEVYRKAWKVPN